MKENILKYIKNFKKYVCWEKTETFLFAHFQTV